MQELTTGMRERGINRMKWIDRIENKIKINTLGTVKCGNIDTLYKYIILLLLFRSITGSIQSREDKWVVT